MQYNYPTIVEVFDFDAPKTHQLKTAAIEFNKSILYSSRNNIYFIFINYPIIILYKVFSYTTQIDPSAVVNIKLSEYCNVK